MKFELIYFKTTSLIKRLSKFGSQEFIDIAYNAAAESITLLKNSNAILPLNKDEKY
jgi:beta-glucosidase